jgi:sortase A
MRDKRPVDELSIEELERILVIRKREARLARLRRYEGRRFGASSDSDEALLEEVAEPVSGSAPGSAPAEAAAGPSSEPPKVYYEDSPRFEDELDDRFLHGGRSQNEGKRRSARLWNRLLLLVEIAAALGLVFLFVSLLQSLQTISQTTADIQAQFQATANARLVLPTPTPVISVNRVLPVGHKVTLNDQGVVVSASFNLDEVPAEYRSQYQAMLSATPMPQPTPSPAGPIRIQIPKINVDSTIVSGDGWQELQLGVGHHIGSANPGERGNMVLSAHNDVYGEIFRHLDQLKPGDMITVTAQGDGGQGSKDYTYVVQSSDNNVRPEQTEVMDSHGDERRLTLISCYPYRVDNRRIVVYATLQNS